MTTTDNPTLSHKVFSSDIAVNDGERAVTAIISTTAVDRDGECLIPGGCNSKAYQSNPVVLLNHSYWDLPVGRCAALKREADAITAKVVFATRPSDYPADKEWVPDVLLSLFQQKTLSAFSVGFVPLETRPATDRDIEKFGAGCRRVVSKWELLEFSIVCIPCNSEAVALAVSKSMIKPDTAKALFGYEAKAEEQPPEPKPEEKSETKPCKDCGVEYPPDKLNADGLCEACAGKAAKEDEEEEKAQPPVKTYAFYVGSLAAPETGADVAGIVADTARKAAGDAVAKARGIVYVL